MYFMTIRHCVSGFCIKGCKTPYHGKKCDESCPTLCMNGTCNQITGTCISCGIGKHGDMCDESKLLYKIIYLS
jgi:hypothetical protein